MEEETDEIYSRSDESSTSRKEAGNDDSAGSAEQLDVKKNARNEDSVGSTEQLKGERNVRNNEGVGSAEQLEAKRKEKTEKDVGSMEREKDEKVPEKEIDSVVPLKSLRKGRLKQANEVRTEWKTNGIRDETFARRCILECWLLTLMTVMTITCATGFWLLVAATHKHEVDELVIVMEHDSTITSTTRTTRTTKRTRTEKQTAKSEQLSTTSTKMPRMS